MEQQHLQTQKLPHSTPFTFLSLEPKQDPSLRTLPPLLLSFIHFLLPPPQKTLGKCVSLFSIHINSTNLCKIFPSMQFLDSPLLSNHPVSAYSLMARRICPFTLPHPQTQESSVAGRKGELDPRPSLTSHSHCGGFPSSVRKQANVGVSPARTLLVGGRARVKVPTLFFLAQP